MVTRSDSLSQSEIRTLPLTAQMAADVKQAHALFNLGLMHEIGALCIRALPSSAGVRSRFYLNERLCRCVWLLLIVGRGRGTAGLSFGEAVLRYGGGH